MKEGASTTNMSSVKVGSKGAEAGCREEAIMGEDLELALDGMGVMVARMLGGYMPWAGTATGRTLAKLEEERDWEDLEGTGTAPRPKNHNNIMLDVDSKLNLLKTFNRTFAPTFPTRKPKAMECYTFGPF